MKNPIGKKAMTILKALKDSEMPWLTEKELAELTGFDDATIRWEMSRFSFGTMPLVATIFQKELPPRYHLHDYGRAVIRGLESQP